MEKAESDKVSLVAKEDLTVLIKKGDSKEFTKKIKVYEEPKLPINKGTALGMVEVYKGKDLVGKVELVNNKDVNKASYLKMLQRVIDNML